MFCACMGILLCFFIIVAGIAISSVDVMRYDFGLYYVLLAVVGLMGSLTLCVIRPTKFCGIRDPKWYTEICGKIHQALVDAQEKRLAAQMLQLELAEAGSTISTGPTTTTKRSGGLRHQRATLMMLGPAVELMHHVIHGVAESKEEEDEDGNKSTLQEDSTGQSLWWDSYQAMKPVAKEKRTRSKRKKRPKRPKVDFNLSTVPSASSEAVAVVSCQPQNNVTAISLQMPSNTDNDDKGVDSAGGTSL